MCHVGGNVGFEGLFDGGEGVYSTLGGLHVVADTSTIVPGGTGTFIEFSSVSFDGERVAFAGRELDAPNPSVFVEADDGIELIAANASVGSIDAGNVVYGLSSWDTCVKYGSTHHTIISPGDMLDGEEVLRAGCEKEGLDGTRLGLIVDFDDSRAIYVADFSGLCPGDLDFDADVDLSDLAILLAHYGECSGDPEYWIFADIDRRGCVGLEDLAILLGNYGTTCD